MVVGPASALKRVSFQCRMRGRGGTGGPKKFLQVVAALPGWQEIYLRPKGDEGRNYSCSSSPLIPSPSSLSSTECVTWSPRSRSFTRRVCRAMPSRKCMPCAARRRRCFGRRIRVRLQYLTAGIPKNAKCGTVLGMPALAIRMVAADGVRNPTLNLYRDFNHLPNLSLPLTLAPLPACCRWAVACLGGEHYLTHHRSRRSG